MKPLTPRPVEWIHDAPLKVSASRNLAAGADEVFAVLADHASWPTWFASVSSVELTGATSGIGAERTVTVRGLGRVAEEFNAWEPGEQFGFTVVGMSRPSLNSLNELVTIQAGSDGVTVTYTQGFDPKGWVKPVLAVAAKRAIPKVLGGALEQLEAYVIAQR